MIHLPEVDWQHHLLGNGLRLVTMKRPHTLTVAIWVLVRAGSRFDCEMKLRPDEVPPQGMAHFMEHLLFRGSSTRDQRQLYAAVEDHGGELSASTGKDIMSVWADVPGDGYVSALDVLSDIIIRPLLREEDFWEEKLVVLEEIRRACDSQSLLFDLFAQTLWRDHPLRFPIRGSLHSLHRLTYEQVRTFYESRFVAGNMLLVICGDIDHDLARQAVAETFGDLRHGPELPPSPFHEEPPEAPRRVHRERDLNQLLLLLGVPTVGLAEADRIVLRLMERVLGMGGSARLHQRLRQQERLVYSVNTVSAHYEDTGYFAVRTACDPAQSARAQELIFDEWEKLWIADKQDIEWANARTALAAAKNNYAGRMLRDLETNRAMASWFGHRVLFGIPPTPEQSVAATEAVQLEDLTRVARTYLRPQRTVLASVGRGPEN